MSNTEFDQVREDLDDSMSNLLLASLSLETVCGGFLDKSSGEDGFVRVLPEKRDAITWLAGQLKEITERHVRIWERLDELMRKDKEVETDDQR
ncbi:hypothetical protein CCR94_10615 [Rhodoblastus sphagnicola]|uniref:Uncharacterized protein n=1 Tax=Rhodoblastus sphagnicola TaxID=333368 RepID=A0A2S6N8R0_9HYPH|nr:hypothetical protein [Rhodoblastus sphagnicola]MBB4201142.1 hypothetical protein [Rhodoblastus sphagnicola]PPQ31003.1 hypothetical protein CCR94_10615 [Rhodoblastus sphagnicola]